ncbi:MAG: hypothetical protein IKG46_11565 [Solobacterium sp.]|nr:hypothetical protein [Solobacterium sp.]
MRKPVNLKWADESGPFQKEVLTEMTFPDGNDLVFVAVERTGEWLTAFVSKTSMMDSLRFLFLHDNASQEAEKEFSDRLMSAYQADTVADMIEQIRDPEELYEDEIFLTVMANDLLYHDPGMNEEEWLAKFQSEGFKIGWSAETKAMLTGNYNAFMFYSSLLSEEALLKNPGFGHADDPEYPVCQQEKIDKLRSQVDETAYETWKTEYLEKEYSRKKDREWFTIPYTAEWGGSFFMTDCKGNEEELTELLKILAKADVGTPRKAAKEEILSAIAKGL